MTLLRAVLVWADKACGEHGIEKDNIPPDFQEETTTTHALDKLKLRKMRPTAK